MNKQYKTLFICSRNKWRSPTAEVIFKRKGFSTRSAGTSPNAKKTVSVSDLMWADSVFVMESKHKSRLKAQFSRALTYKPIHVLDIPDEYKYMDAELITELEARVAPPL